MTPWYRSDHEQARAVIDEALGAPRGAPRRRHARSSTVVTFGLCLLHDGPQERPRLHLEETIFPFHRFARAQAIGYALNNLAWTARATGDIDARPRPRSTRRSSASAPSRTAAARR